MAALAKVMAPAQFGLDENSLPAVRRKRSIPALDGLRAIAVGGVVFMHVASVFSPKLFDLGAFRGWYGVDLFFVLSGFLITWLLAEELDAAGTLNVPRFYGRRAMRLMPAYGTLIICAVLGSKGSNYRLIVAALPYLLTYMFNFWVAAHHSVPAVLGQVWSLSIEEQFYLVWPWILLRFGTRRGLYIALATIVAVAVYRTTLFSYLTWPHPRGISVASAERIYFSTDTRIDVIFIGCALALLLRDDRFASTFKAWATNPRLRFLTLGMAVSCLVWGTGARSASFWRDATVGYTVMAGASAALIASIFLRPDSFLARALSIRPMRFVGKISYGIYLFHMFLLSSAMRAARIHHGTVLDWHIVIAAFLFVGLGSVALAALHYHVIERPLLRWRDRKMPSDSTTLSAHEAVPTRSPASESAKGVPLDEIRSLGAIGMFEPSNG